MSWAFDLQNFFVLIYGPGISWLLPSLLALVMGLLTARLFISLVFPNKGPR